MEAFFLTCEGPSAGSMALGGFGEPSVGSIPASLQNVGYLTINLHPRIDLKCSCWCKLDLLCDLCRERGASGADSFSRIFKPVESGGTIHLDAVVYTRVVCR
jgi:hypothetical protein